MSPLLATRNPAAARLFRTLARLAPSELPILVEGETGSGKSSVARALHRRGRSGRPFVVVDCGAIPDTLLAAELFGHRAGAFTDATRARSGRLAEAGEGTLVLERLEVLSPAAQVAMLRVLEERLIVPVGGARPERFGARVVSLVDLGVAERLADGSLRPDLYHRLAGFHATLPPLRQRREDILPFARRTLRRLAGRADAPRRLTPEACEMFLAYPWPGNFRELGTVLQRACLASDEELISVDNVVLTGAGWPQVMAEAGDRLAPLKEVSRAYALWVLSREGGNVSRAAGVLGISRRTLIRWRQDQ